MKTVSYLSLGLVALMLSSCGIKTRVLKVDRQDQNLYGNRGYLNGEGPEPTEERKSYRSIIEVDISHYTEPKGGA